MHKKSWRQCNQPCFPIYIDSEWFLEISSLLNILRKVNTCFSENQTPLYHGIGLKYWLYCHCALPSYLHKTQNHFIDDLNIEGITYSNHRSTKSWILWPHKSKLFYIIYTPIFYSALNNCRFVLKHKSTLKNNVIIENQMIWGSVVIIFYSFSQEMQSYNLWYYMNLCFKLKTFLAHWQIGS